MSILSSDEIIDLLEDTCEFAPEGDDRVLFVDGVPLRTPLRGNGLFSAEIIGRRALDNLGLTDVEIAYEFLYPGKSRILLDQTVAWGISFDGGADITPCNLRAITQDRTGQGWNILVDLARRELLPNFTITWQLGLGTFVTDVGSGNPIEATEEQTTYAVMAQRSASRNVSNPGNDPARFQLEGYFCDTQGNPVNTPEGFQWQRAWPTTWTDDQTGLQHNGRFTPALATETPLKNRPVDSGSQLQGWFISLGTGAIGGA